MPLPATAPNIDIRGQPTDSTPSTASRRDRSSRDGEYARRLYSWLSETSTKLSRKQTRKRYRQAPTYIPMTLAGFAGSTYPRWLYHGPPTYQKSFSPTTLRPQKSAPLTGHGKQAGLRSQRVELITCDVTSSKRILHCHACSAVCNVASVRCAVGACAVVSAPLQKCAHATAARYGLTWKYFWEGCTSEDACVR